MTIRAILLKGAGAWLVFLAVPSLVHGFEFQAGNTRIFLGGYAKLNLIYNDASDGRLVGAEEEFGTDFYLPFAIPVDGDGESHQTLFLSAKESRFTLGTKTNLSGNRLTTYFEIDFLTTETTANEAFTNSFAPRLRHYFFTFNDYLLMGQTWSTFENEDTLPATLDFVGPAESVIFVRQPQIRYMWGPWEFAIENPETELYNNGGPPPVEEGATNVFRLGTRTNDGEVPDFVARYNLETEFGSFALAGLGRVLTVDNGNPDFIDRNDTALGYGISLSGVIPTIGEDEMVFQLNGGDGIGRYMGFGPADGVIDDIGEIEPIPQYGGYVGYTHLWSPKWSSTVVGGYRQIDNPVEFTGTNVEKEAYSGHVNLVYSPVEPVTFGVELIYAQRELEGGANGSISRVQVAGKYEF
jgi:DcaP outer membrane protein